MAQASASKRRAGTRAIAPWRAGDQGGRGFRPVADAAVGRSPRVALRAGAAGGSGRASSAAPRARSASMAVRPRRARRNGTVAWHPGRTGLRGRRSNRPFPGASRHGRAMRAMQAPRSPMRRTAPTPASTRRAGPTQAGDAGGGGSAGTRPCPQRSHRAAGAQPWSGLHAAWRASALHRELFPFPGRSYRNPHDGNVPRAAALSRRRRALGLRRATCLP